MFASGPLNWFQLADFEHDVKAITTAIAVTWKKPAISLYLIFNVLGFRNLIQGGEIIIFF